MARRIVGLDLGAYSVKLIRLETAKQGNRLEILDAVEEIIPLIEADERTLLDKQKDAVISLQQKGLMEAEAFIIGLRASEGHIRSMPVPFADLRKIEAVLPGLLESEVPFEIDEMITSWQPYGAQEKAALSLPEERIKIAFGKKAAIASTIQMLQSIGVDARIMHLNSVALYELVREFGARPFLAISTAEMVGKNRILAAMIDFGHLSTNICIFDSNGLVTTKTLLRGGEKLSADIAAGLDIPFIEAQKLQHDYLHFDEEPADEKIKQMASIGLGHFEEISDEIIRTFIALRTEGLGELSSVILLGGGANTRGLDRFFAHSLASLSCKVSSINAIVPKNMPGPQFALSLSFACSGMHLHAKENRFNFRKDEFQWRGDLDFLRTNSTSLILWALVLICSLTTLWATSAMVLDKENSIIEEKLKKACSLILEKKDVPSSKCLAMMKEQISSNIDLGVPEYTASDVYLDTAKFLPAGLPVTFTELDVQEKRVRIKGETGNFEDVEKVVAEISKIPCFVKVEKGRAQAREKGVELQLSNDIDCGSQNQIVKQ